MCPRMRSAREYISATVQYKGENSLFRAVVLTDSKAHTELFLVFIGGEILDYEPHVRPHSANGGVDLRHYAGRIQQGDAAVPTSFCINHAYRLALLVLRGLLFARCRNN